MPIDPQTAKANKIGERIRTGEINHAQGLAELTGTAAPTITDTGFTDFELGVRNLQRDFPALDQSEIMQHLGNAGLETVRHRIDAERATVLAEQQTNADAAHAASPEGRAAAAQALSDAQIQKASQARNARLLLVDEGTISEDEASLINDDEALRYAGFIQTEDPFRADANDYNANMRAAGEASQ